jgi:hypothetical protein
MQDDAGRSDSRPRRRLDDSARDPRPRRSSSTHRIGLARCSGRMFANRRRAPIEVAGTWSRAERRSARMSDARGGARREGVAMSPSL